MTRIDYLVASSMGNDSIALIQYMLESGKSFAVVYNDTGWARDDWPKRVQKVSAWLLEKGVTLYITKSIGMADLVRKKKGWPMPASKMQWCTGELKELPTLELLEKIDPDGDITVVTGRRRQESQNRADLPQYQTESPKHGGRECWNPLYLHDVEMRNELLARAGFDVLPHSSMECYPCCCANKADLALMDEAGIAKVEALELELGFTRKGKPRVMFRPYRIGGAVGIRQAVEWGKGPRGWKSQFVPAEYIFHGHGTDGLHDERYDADSPEARQCDGGFCGS